MKDFCQKWKVKLIFRGAYRLPGTGIVQCLEIVDVGCNLKLMAWPDPPWPSYFSTTDLRCLSVRRVGRSELADSGHHLAGALLRHLSPVAVQTLADRVALVPRAGQRLGVLGRRHASDCCQPETQAARQRSSQVHRGTAVTELKFCRQNRICVKVWK